MNAQTVFDCNDLKKEIISYLPIYPIITKKMIDKRMRKYRQWADFEKTDCCNKIETMFGKFDKNGIIQRIPRWETAWYNTLTEIRSLDNEWWLVDFVNYTYPAIPPVVVGREGCE